MTNPPANTASANSLTYIGRFAPSPSGPLHFGSLVTALASFLDAKSHCGQWLVRIEDLDPPREMAGASKLILECLQAHELCWDGDIYYQSRALNSYQTLLDDLIAQQLAYACSCSRQRLQALGGIYDGHCRSLQPDPLCAQAWRLKAYDLPPEFALSERVSFEDLIQGKQTQNLRTEAGDQILKRRDGLFAYQLAVVADDIAQGITHIIRGSDLLEVTARQVAFFELLKKPPPIYGHIPVAIQANGQKLSKQNMAPPLLPSAAAKNLWHGLAFLGQNPPLTLTTAKPSEILEWAIAHWQIHKVKGLSQLYSAYCD